MGTDIEGKKRCLPKSFQFGGEGPLFALLAIIDRLHTQAVADQKNGTAVPVQQRKGEHPDEARQRRFQTPLPRSRQDDFRVRGAAETVADGLQLGSKPLVVIDFAVEANDHAAVFRGHWLIAGLR